MSNITENISNLITWKNYLGTKENSSSDTVGYDGSIRTEKGTFIAPKNATKLKLDEKLYLYYGRATITIYVIISEKDNEYINCTMASLIEKNLIQENIWPSQEINKDTVESYSWEINYNFEANKTYYIYFIPYDTTRDFAAFNSEGTATLYTDCYTLTYIKNDGKWHENTNPSDTILIAKGETYTIGEEYFPNKDFKNFGGWQSSLETEKIYWPNQTISSINQDITLTAIWEEPELINDSINSNPLQVSLEYKYQWKYFKINPLITDTYTFKSSGTTNNKYAYPRLYLNKDLVYSPETQSQNFEFEYKLDENKNYFLRIDEYYDNTLSTNITINSENYILIIDPAEGSYYTYILDEDGNKQRTLIEKTPTIKKIILSEYNYIPISIIKYSGETENTEIPYDYTSHGYGTCITTPTKENSRFTGWECQEKDSILTMVERQGADNNTFWFIEKSSSTINNKTLTIKAAWEEDKPNIPEEEKTQCYLFINNQWELVTPYLYEKNLITNEYGWEKIIPHLYTEKKWEKI